MDCGGLILTEEGIDDREKGLDEVRATEVAGCLEFVGDAGTDQRGHRFIQRLAEPDGLEMLGFFVDSGDGENLRKTGNSGEQGHLIDPTGKGFRIPAADRGGSEEAPVLGADAEQLLAALTNGASLRGFPLLFRTPARCSASLARWIDTQVIGARFRGWPPRPSELRRMATIESVGSSTRTEGSKLTDAEVAELLERMQTESFLNRNEEEVVG